MGALTSRPYAFNARPWELKKTESIDVMDALGSNIRVDAKGAEVMRVLPRLNEAVNEEWISDKTRHACDGLLRRRLDRPYVRIDGKLREASWAQAFAAIAGKIKATSPDRIGVIAGDLVRRRADEGGDGPVRLARGEEPRLPAGRDEAGRRGLARAGCSTRGSRGSKRRTRSCWSGPTRARKRRS